MKMKSIFAGFLHGIFLGKTKDAFCNIAEGTHAGSITMTAAEAIDTPNLVVCAGALQNEILIAGVANKPIGVCTDEGASADAVAVALPGCAESTFICVAAVNINAGDNLYTAAAGKVSNVAADGSYKIGTALCAASAGCVVEVDPQGFGQRAFQIHSGGIYTWTGSTASESISVSGLVAADIVVASLHSSSASVSTVKAQASADGITFTLNAAGTAGSEKIAWIAIRKN